MPLSLGGSYKPGTQYFKSLLQLEGLSESDILSLAQDLKQELQPKKRIQDLPRVKRPVLRKVTITVISYSQRVAK